MNSNVVEGLANYSSKNQMLGDGSMANLKYSKYFWSKVPMDNLCDIRRSLLGIKGGNWIRG